MIELKLNVNTDINVAQANQVSPETYPNRKDYIITLRFDHDTTTHPASALKYLENGSSGSYSKGLYIDKSLLSTQKGLIDQSGSFMRVGYQSGYATSINKTGLVTVNNVVHRIFTSVNDVIIDFRSAVDTIKPGDIVRVPRSTSLTASDACEYFLITKTTETSLDSGRVGNAISEKVSLGNFSWCGSNVGYDEYVEYLKSQGTSSTDGGESS